MRARKKLSREYFTDLPSVLAMFEVEISNIEAYHNLVRLLAVVDKMCFNMDKTHILLLARSHVAMVYFVLPWQFFDKYLARARANSCS